MKFLIAVLLTALLSLVACLYLPWWSIAVVAFITAAIIKLQPGLSMLAGFTGLFVLWGLIAWYLSSNNNHLLAHKVAMLILKTDSPFMLILLTAFVGGLTAGMAALAGSYVHKKRASKVQATALEVNVQDHLKDESSPSYITD